MGLVKLIQVHHNIFRLYIPGGIYCRKKVIAFNYLTVNSNISTAILKLLLK